MIHGQIDHLTQDGKGYVYWRGQHVEHYSYPAERAAEESQAALELRTRCIHLEALGIPVTSRTATWYAGWYEGLTPDIMANLDPLLRSLLMKPRDLWEKDGAFAWIAESQARTDGPLRSIARVCTCENGYRDSFMLDSDDIGGFYHPMVALGWRPARMGQGEMQGCCYATTAQLLAWFDSKMGVAA